MPKIAPKISPDLLKLITLKMIIYLSYKLGDKNNNFLNEGDLWKDFRPETAGTRTPLPMIMQQPSKAISSIR